jgi:hypothetical protein
MLGRAIEQNQKIGVDVMLIQNSAATLGRLVEQYYWKFIHEKAAIRGVKISESAKTGGRLRAAKHKHEHAAWARTSHEFEHDHRLNRKTEIEDQPIREAHILSPWKHGLIDPVGRR